jgi:polyketide synthase PksJ
MDNNGETGLEIAVIGLAGRFPGAPDIAVFWDNLKQGVESIAFLTGPELAEVDPQLRQNPDFVRTRGGFLEDIEYFDASFFHYTPDEAEQIPPQSRLLHECAWTALEDAGYDPDAFQGPIGLYVGASSSHNWEILTASASTAGDQHTYASYYLNNRDFLSTLISYKLNLKGPAYSVHTTCSTSLVAIHLACQGLLSGDCDMALAGGAAVRFEDDRGYLYREGMILSADGHCRAFDAGAKGTVGGSGAGIVVLRRLTDALSKADHIYAVIKGSAVNNDGSRRVGYTAPSVEGQAEVIRQALRLAEVDPQQIGYVESHGTATPLGDVTEVEALKIAFNTDKKHYCALGALKTNMGHLDIAAGVAGFIKTVLAVQQRQIPPTIHFQTPNPRIDFENSPFYINTTLREWPDGDGQTPRRAGVSSFGIGGTNAHLVLEEAPVGADHRGESQGTYQLLLLSARTESALEQMGKNLARHLRNHPHIDLADVAYTLQVGRPRFACRRRLVCRDVSRAVASLEAPAPRQAARSDRQDRPVVFMFPGLGGQYVNMGRELYHGQPVFRQEMERCFHLLGSLLDDDIKEILYPPQAGTGPAENMDRTDIAQAVIFIFEYALVKMLMAWGIRPRAMIGYSFGEYVAACTAGVFDLPDALKLVAARGRLMRRLAPGMMLSVPLPARQVKPLLHGGLSIGIDNGQSCVVSGPLHLVEQLAQQLKERKLLCLPLKSSQAVHSPMMEPILQPFQQEAGKIGLNPPQIPYVSGVTGQWITVEDATKARYWARQLRQTVRFAAGIRTLLEEPDSIFVEVGPGRDLAALLGREMAGPGERPVVSLVKQRGQEQGDDHFLLSRIGWLWCRGVRIDWHAYHGENRRNRLSLPTYPFEGRRFWKWVDDYKSGKFSLAAAVDGWGTTNRGKLADWFYVPSWKRRELAEDSQSPSGSGWLIFGDPGGLGSHLAERFLEDSRQPVVRVGRGSAYAVGADGKPFTMNPAHYDDYERLVKDLLASGFSPRRIVHLWGVAGDPGQTEPAFSDGYLDSGFYSLLYLARALVGNRRSGDTIEINVVTDQVQDVTGDEPLQPAKAGVLACCKVISQEYPDVVCRSVDIVVPETGTPRYRQLVHQLYRECQQPTEAQLAAYRGGHRWVQVFEPLSLAEREASALLKEGGVYWLVGGLGDIGCTLAEYLVQRYRARLAFTGRTPLPAPEMWQQLLLIGGEDDRVSQYIRRITQLQQAGGEVLYVCADVADSSQMAAAAGQIKSHFAAPIDGIIHAASDSVFATIEEITLDQCQRQFRAKMPGLLVLEEIAGELRPDFVLVISSLSTVLGGLGFVAYAAANQFMDTFAVQHNRTGREPWMVVNWEGMNKEDTAEAFHLVFCSRFQRQLIFSSGGDLEGRIAGWLTAARHNAEGEGKKAAPSPLYGRPELENDYVAPGNAVEQRLAAIWQNFFGIEQIGVTDDLFDLGGDSLKAINILAIIHKEMQVTIPLKAFFDQPTIRAVAGYLVATNGAENGQYPAVRPVEKREYYELSFHQRRLWFIHCKEPETIAFHTPGLIPLNHGVDEEAVERTVRCLVERHESFRTAFKVVEERPVQQIVDDLPIRLKKIDLSPLPEGERVQTRQQIFEREATSPFDLSQAPLCRFLLVKLGGRQYEFIFNIHHIITDGWTEQILKREFSLYYEGFRRGETYCPGPLKCQYRDFAIWHNGRLGHDTWQAEAHRFWTDKLKEGVPVLELPGKAGEENNGRRGAAYRCMVDNEGLDRLKKLARQRNTTLFTILFSAYLMTLSRFSGHKEVACAIIAAGRDHPDLHPIVGFFVNSILFIARIDEGEPFADFLTRMHRQLTETFGYQDYPLELVFEELKTRYPDIPVSFNMLNVQSETAEETVDHAQPHHIDTIQDVKFHIEPYVTEYKSGLDIRWTYNRGMFKPSTIEYLGTEYVKLLDFVSRHPGQNYQAFRQSKQKKVIWEKPYYDHQGV